MGQGRMFLDKIVISWPFFCVNHGAVVRFAWPQKKCFLGTFFCLKWTQQSADTCIVHMTFTPFAFFFNFAYACGRVRESVEEHTYI